MASVIVDRSYLAFISVANKFVSLGAANKFVSAGKEMKEQTILQRLMELQDLKYREFNRKLIPNVDQKFVIGIRTPALRKLAKEIEGSDMAEEFLNNLPHTYHEENSLHGFLIERIKEYDVCIEAMDRFLPYVNNWAVCDQMRPKVFKKHKLELLEQIKIWLQSEHIYTVRFAIEMLMTHYLEEDFSEEYLVWVSQIRSEEYYLNMMIAWYFATALAKQYKATLPYLEEQKLDIWTHNKTIQKAVESYRITEKQKVYLKTLKRKKY